MPRIKDAAKAIDVDDVSSHTGKLPKYSPGDLLLWIVLKDASAGTALSTPTGWSKFWSDSTNNEVAIFYKTAQAGETPPTTSSSDIDAYASVMYSIEGAGSFDAPTSVYSASSSYSITIPSYTLPGPNRLVFWLAHSSSSHAPVIGPTGFYPQVLETTGASFAVQSDIFYNEPSTPSMDGVGEYTGNIRAIVFSISDDGTGKMPAKISDSWISRVIDYIANETSYVALDVNGNPTVPSEITSLEGVQVVAPPASTSNTFSIDKGTCPYQRAWQIRMVKDTRWNGTHIDLSAASQPAVSCASDEFIVAHIYPQQSRYASTAGPVERGVDFAIIDTAGNWVAYPVGGNDDVKRVIGPTFSVVVDPSYTGTAVDSSGTLQTTSLNKFAMFVVPEGGTCYYLMSRFYKAREMVLVGGTSSVPGGLDTFFEFANGAWALVVTKLAETYQFSLPIRIGNNSTPTYFHSSRQSIVFPQLSSRDKKDVGFHIPPEKIGITFDVKSGDQAILNEVSISSPSGFFIKNTGSGGSIQIDACSISNADLIETGVGMAITNTEFIGCGTIKLSSGSTFDGNNIVGSKGNVASVELVDVDTLSNTTISEPYIGVDITNSGTTNFVLDGVHISGGTYHVANNTTGAITVRLINGSTLDASKLLETGGPITIVSSARIEVTGFVPGSRIFIEDTDTSTVIYNDIPASDPLVVYYDIPGTQANVLVRARKASSSPRYKPWEQTLIVDSSGAKVIIDQDLDE